jgi:hypothetical protein
VPRVYTPEQKAAKAARERLRFSTPEGKEAARERQRRYQATPKAKAKKAEYDRKRAATPEGRAANLASVRRYAKTPKGKAMHRRVVYGLTYEAFESMLAAQSGQCALCAKPMFPPHVDHDHVTGKIRSLLCGLCNRGLGHFKDDPAVLTAAAAYVQRHAQVAA